MSNSENMDKLKAQLEEEMAKWQTQIDEAKVQANLVGMEAAEKLRPHIESLEQEMYRAKNKLADFESASEKSWTDVKAGLDLSVEAMKEAFANAKKHFDSDKTS